MSAVLRPARTSRFVTSADLQRVFGVNASTIGRWIGEDLLRVTATEMLFDIDDVRRFMCLHSSEALSCCCDVDALGKLLLSRPVRPRRARQGPSTEIARSQANHE